MSLPAEQLLSPGGPDAPDEIEEQLNVQTLLTQGLNAHAARLDAISRAVMQLERTLVQQAEEAQLSRAEAERQAAEAHARAEMAEERASAAVRAADARALAAEEALERRVASLEAQLASVPGALEDLRTRATKQELRAGVQEREVTARAAEIAECREKHASLEARVATCPSADELRAAEDAMRAAAEAQRAEIEAVDGRARAAAMQASGLHDGHASLERVIAEQHAAIGAVQSAVTDSERNAESLGAQLGALAAVQKSLEASQAALNESTQSGLARAVSHAEAVRSDKEKIVGAIDEMGSWGRRLDRLETDLSEFERRVNSAADMMKRQAEHLESAQRGSAADATQQVALHVKALSGDLLRELATKAAIEDTKQLFDALHRQLATLRESHKSLVTRVEAQGAAAELVADEAAAANLQAQGALRGSDRLREETQSWLSRQLESRPTSTELETAAAAAADLAVRDALSLEKVLETTFVGMPVPPAVPADGAGGNASLWAPHPAPASAHLDALRGVQLPNTPAGTLLRYVRDLLVSPIESRLENVELGCRHLELGLQEEGRARSAERDELLRKLPSLDQVQTLQGTLNQHVQRLPAVVVYPHGRWAWKGGRLRASARAPQLQPPSVPWSSERLNTAPDTFVWGHDRPYIEVSQSGLFSIATTVFAPGAPTIAVAVNGQPVLRRIASTRQMVDASGMIAGVTIRDVISVSPGARVSVLCDVGNVGLGDAHAVLEMKKLW